MSAPETTRGRIRAYFQFILAVLYFFVARVMARHGAAGLAGDAWRPLVEQAMLVFLLLFGYAGMGLWFNREPHPLGGQGWPRRPGFGGEAGIGIAVGWTIAVLCVLPMAVLGGIAISITMHASSWGWLAADAAFFALWALAEEIAFRGYGFQRFADAVGSLGAALGFAAYYAIVQALLPGASRASIAVSVALSLVLSTAFVRTRALWMSWGINFAWKASRGLLFGLAVSGINSHSPVVQGDPMGPFWVTGGGFGLDSSWVTFVVLLAAIPSVYRVTRDLDFRYNAPVLIPGGIPVDLDAASRRQHEAAMGPAQPEVKPLVQILPASAPEPIRPPVSPDEPDSTSH